MRTARDAGIAIGRTEGVLQGLRIRRALTALAVALAVAVLPFAMPSERWMRILVLVVIYVALASGLNVLVGYAGLLDLGYIAFYAVGAYVTALITVRVAIDHLGYEAYASRLWWLPFATLLLGAVLAALVAGILGYPTLRARGDYLAIMTLGLGEIVRLIAINWTDLTRGPAGIPDVPAFALGELQLYEPRQVYFVALIVACAAVLGIRRLLRSYVGWAWQTIREDQLVAETVGIRTVRYKLLAYMVGGFVAGLIGVVFAHTQSFINPDSFRLTENFVVLALVIVGGSGTLIGPIVGAAVWIAFDQSVATTALVQEHPEMRQLMLGVVVLLILRFAPGGLVRGVRRGRRTGRWRGALDRLPSRLRARSARAGAPAHVPAGAPTSATLPAPERLEPRERAGSLGLEPREEAADHRLEGRDIVCRFGGLAALKGVSIDVRPGEIVGLIGPNGAGKTTFINVITGVLPPTDGGIVLDGHPVRLRRPSDAATEGVARTFQTIRVLGEATVLENVLVGGHRHLHHGPAAALGIGRRARGSEEQVRERALALLAYVGLADRARDTASSLSYGHQRRLEIARALMTQPRFLCLDEPAAGMNPAETAGLKELIGGIRGSGIGVLLVEHDMSLLMGVSDRIVVLDHGELIAEGSPSEVRQDPAVIEAYLGRDDA